MNRIIIVMENAEEAMTVTASCPVCNKEVPLDTINSHIDVCLLPGGQNLQNEKHHSEKEQDIEPLTEQLDVAHHSKRTSSPLPASGKGKQSILPFCKASSFPQTSPTEGLGAICEEDEPPPAKSRKMDTTPKSSLRTTRNIHLQDEGTKKSISQGSKPSTASLPASQADTKPAAGDLPLPLVDLQAPLAELVRPSSIEEFVGQESVVGKNAVLRSILETGQVPSLIFWGPPGCGKTTLARIISKIAKQKAGSRFVQLSATTSGVSEVKQVVKVAKSEKTLLKAKTILFVDEIHRFNKLQQDTFLPHVEDGTITLLGATTENPSFQLNSALLSRCRVIVLEKLQAVDVETLLRRSLKRLGAKVMDDSSQDQRDGCSNGEGHVMIEPEALVTLAQLCDGDARSALNGLQLAVQAKQAQSHQERTSRKSTAIHTSLQHPETPDCQKTEHMSSLDSVSSEDTPPSFDAKPFQKPSPSSTTHALQLPVVTVQDIKESLQRTHLLYDQAGEEHYNIISALHKSMRGSDTNASLYWLARMLCAGEDPLYVARRIVRFASEDIGLADPNALSQAVAAFQGCKFIGMPECEVILAQAVVYMARAPKSIEVLSAYSNAKRCVNEHKGPLPSVPLHLRNAPTRLMKSLGYSKGYKYNPKESAEDQQYLPKDLLGAEFFQTD